LPLHVPHMMIRIGEMMLISVGEVSIAITQNIPRNHKDSEWSAYSITVFAFLTLLMFKLLYFDVVDVETDNHALKTNKYKGFLYVHIHSVLFGATTLMGLCVKIFVTTNVGADLKTCEANDELFDPSGTMLMCGSLMLFSVLILQCLHRGIHTHRTVAEDLVHLECELISLEQEISNQYQDCAIDIQLFKGLLRILDDPADVKRIFGKELVLPPVPVPSEAQKAEAQEKQLVEVFNMFATDGSTRLGAKELQSLHLFLREAAVIDKQRTHYATQSRLSKILRLLLSVFLLAMALIRSQRVSIGAASEMYRIGDKCFAVGVGVFSPIGTFAMLAATFFAALAIDWVAQIIQMNDIKVRSRLSARSSTTLGDTTVESELSFLSQDSPRRRSSIRPYQPSIVAEVRVSIVPSKSSDTALLGV